MTSEKQKIAIASLTLFLSALAFISRTTVAKDEKLKPQELVAKHLESIGPAEKRNAVKTRGTAGLVEVVFRVGGNGTLQGKGNILSQGHSLRVGFGFAARDYPGEQIAYDGNKVTVGFMSPGNYPPLAGFLYDNDVLLKEGLLFGTLSTGWFLLDPASQPKLELTGLKKVEGRQLYELKYRPRSSKISVQASLYFEPETFRHVRSQFRIEVPTAQVAAITDTSETVRYQILEQFDQFKETDGLMLPHSYKIDLTIDAPRGGMLTSWNYVIDRIIHNETIEPQLFSVQ